MSPATEQLFNNSHILAVHPYLFSRLTFHTYFMNPLPPFRCLSHFLILFVLLLIINTVLSLGVELTTYMTLCGLKHNCVGREGIRVSTESEIGVFKHRSRISYMIRLVPRPS